VGSREEGPNPYYSNMKEALRLTEKKNSPDGKETRVNLFEKGGRRRRNVAGGEGKGKSRKCPLCRRGLKGRKAGLCFSKKGDQISLQAPIPGRDRGKLPRNLKRKRKRPVPPWTGGRSAWPKVESKGRKERIHIFYIGVEKRMGVVGGKKAENCFLAP